MLAAWATPNCPNGGRVSGNPLDIGAKRDGTKAQIDTAAQARLAAWGTPCSQPANGTAENFRARKQRAQAKGIQMGDSITDCAMQAQLAAHGPERIGFLLGRNGWEIRPASGQLNPAHSAWLMAIPEEWCEAAIAASRSLKAKKRERSGSKDTEMQLSVPKQQPLSAPSWRKSDEEV
jgi:hypothetical protein